MESLSDRKIPDIAPRFGIVRSAIDADQQRVVEGNFDGPVVLLGGAGTGKTTVALNRAVWLASNVFTARDELVLVTTNSRALSDQSAELLKSICPEETTNRICVQTLAKTAIEILKAFEIKLEWNWHSTRHLEDDCLAHFLRMASKEVAYRDGPGEKALLNEFFSVVIKGHITVKANYLKDKKSHLDKDQRNKAWSLFRKFRSILAGRGKEKVLSRQEGFEIAAALCRYLDVRPYASVIVDEAHDLDAVALQFLAALSGNDTGSGVANSLFLVADPLQRTYEGACSFEACGIRSEKQAFWLGRNYRNSETIAESVRSEVLHDEPTLRRGNSYKAPTVVRKGGVPCSEFRPGTLTDLISYIGGTFQAWRDRAASSENDFAVLFVDKRRACDIGLELDVSGVPVELYTDYEPNRSKQNRDGNNRVQIRTIYTAKGMAFAGVIIVVGDDERSQLKQMSSLLYVAKSRAKDFLSVVSVDWNALVGSSRGVSLVCANDRSDSSRQQREEQLSGYNRFVESGLCGFEFDRYRDSVRYYCMPHDPKSEEEYASTAKPAFPITDTFRQRVRLILQTPAPSKYLEHSDLRDMPAKGYDFIQTVKFGCEYWRDNASDEEISSKAKYVVDTIDSLGCEMGVAGNHPSVADYVIDILDYAARELERQKTAAPPKTVSATECAQPTTSPDDGAISGYELVERILDRFGDEGVAKLLECVGQGEWEFLEFKTSHLLSDDEKKAGVRQDALTWDIVKAIFGIANTAGGALIIGICKDDKSLWPVAVGSNPEGFIRCDIRQKLLPDQRVWSDGKRSRWSAVSVPTVEARLCNYSDGEKMGNVVVLLIEPQPRGECLRFEDAINRDEKLLCYRERGYGETKTSKDSETFDATDRKRRISRHHYVTLLQKVIPEAGMSSNGKSSGAYRLKPVAGRDVDSCNDELISRTDGHRLRYEFNSGEKIGQYKIIEKIGQGGMGVVYRVEGTTLGGEYALKAFMSTANDCQMQKERFLSEARTLKQLDHKGLPKIHACDYDSKKECLFLVEDLIVGEDNRPHELSKYSCCADSLQKRVLEPISEDQALQWLRQVCEIAVYLHRRGVAHRDITLKNLLLSKDRQIKLTDFGIVKVMNEELRKRVKVDVTMTFTQTPNSPAFLGTLRYLPPEVKNKQKDKIDPVKTDMWAIGICFFKLLTGEWYDGHQFEDFEWHNRIWGKLFKGMLKHDSRKRLTCEGVLKLLTEYETGRDPRYPNFHAVWENVILIDGDDVVRTGESNGGKLLYHMVVALRRKKFDVRVYWSPGKIERAIKSGRFLNARYLLALKQNGSLCCVEEVNGAEFAMLDLCQEHACRIVTNERFGNYSDHYNFLRDTVPFDCSPLCHYSFDKGAFSIAQIVGDRLPKEDDVVLTGELTRNPSDDDLDFLLACTSEELEPLVAAILGTKDRINADGEVLKNPNGNPIKEIDRSGRISSRLDKTAAFKDYFPHHAKYVSDIIAELQLYGGDAIANKFRGYGVPYREILGDVAKHMKLEVSERDTVQDIERNLLEHAFSGIWSKMSLARRKEFLDHSVAGRAGEINRLAVSELMGAGLLATGNVAGSVASVLSEQLMGRGIAAATQFGVGELAMALINPVGWAVAGLSALASCASPSYRVTVPACIYIASLRLLKCGDEVVKTLESENLKYW